MTASGPPPGALAAAMVQLAEHAEQIRALAAAVEELRGQLAGQDGDAGGEGRRYRPIPAPQWWRISGEARDAAITRLRAWVDHVYRPSYGQLAAGLPPCWAEHPSILFMLDWLSELHSVLYLQPGRTAGILAGQGEWQARLLPAAADAMNREGRDCRHRRRP